MNHEKLPFEIEPSLMKTTEFNFKEEFSLDRVLFLMVTRCSVYREQIKY